MGGRAGQRCCVLFFPGMGGWGDGGREGFWGRTQALAAGALAATGIKTPHALLHPGRPFQPHQPQTNRPTSLPTASQPINPTQPNQRSRVLQAFPRVTGLDLHGLVLTPQDMLRLGGLHRLATLRLLRCTLEHPASLLALAGLAQLQCLELEGVVGAGPVVIDDLLPSLTGLQALKVRP